MACVDETQTLEIGLLSQLRIIAYLSCFGAYFAATNLNKLARQFVDVSSYWTETI